MSRLIITAKDVQIILGVSSGHASRIIRVIKRKNNKEKHQKITITEFCNYMGFEVNEVTVVLQEFYKRK